MLFARDAIHKSASELPRPLIDERTVVRHTNMNNMQGWQILHWELSSAGLIRAYKFTISEWFFVLSYIACPHYPYI